MPGALLQKLQRIKDTVWCVALGAEVQGGDLDCELLENALISKSQQIRLSKNKFIYYYVTSNWALNCESLNSLNRYRSKLFAIEILRLNKYFSIWRLYCVQLDPQSE